MPSLPEKGILKIGDIYEMDGKRYIIGLDHPTDPIPKYYMEQIGRGELIEIRQPGAEIYQKILKVVQGEALGGEIVQVACGAKWLEEEIWPSKPKTPWSMLLNWLRRSKT